MPFLKSSIASHGTEVSKNQFHNGIDFSQGIYSVGSGDSDRVERAKDETLLYKVYEKRPN
jgi:hypothetical protein